jgi:hypothetical protein
MVPPAAGAPAQRHPLAQGLALARGSRANPSHKFTIKIDSLRLHALHKLAANYYPVPLCQSRFVHRRQEA